MMAAAAAPTNYKSFLIISQPSLLFIKAKNLVDAKEDELSLKIAMTAKVTVSRHRAL